MQHKKRNRDLKCIYLNGFFHSYIQLRAKRPFILKVAETHVLSTTSLCNTSTNILKRE